MNPKTTNLLLILLLMVGAYFVLFEWQTPTTYEREQAKSTQGPKQGVALFSADELPTELAESVTIRRRDEVVVLSKRSQDWFQTQPVQFPLNSWSVRQMVDDAATLRSFQQFDPADSSDGQWPTLGQISLSSPEVTVLIQFEGDPTKKQEIRLGRQTIGGRGYVMINDDPNVYVVNDALHRQIMDASVKDWRKRSINAPTEGQVHRMTLAGSHEPITVRKVEGDWTFDSPNSGRVDRDAIKGLLAAVGQIAIQKFVADNPADESIYGLNQPGTMLSIDWPSGEARDPGPDASVSEHEGEQLASETGGSGSPQTRILRIGASVDLKNESFFATWQGGRDAGSVVFTLPGSAVEKFAKSVDSLRDPRITPIAVADVRELTIQKPPVGPVKLVRGVGGWSFSEPDLGFEADSASVSLLIESVVEATASSYEIQDLAITDPIATVTLGVIGRDEPEVLRIFPKGEGQTYPVLRNQETIFYRVDSSRFEHLFEPMTALRQRTLLSLDADTLIRVTIGHAGGTVYLFERAPLVASSSSPTTQAASETQPASNVWGLVGYDAFESEAWQRLLSRLSSLRVEGWVIETAEDDPSSSAQSGRERMLTTVQIETASGQHHTLEVDPVRFQGRLVGETEKKEWFKLDEDFVALLGGEFRMRTLFPVNLDQIENVQIIRGDKSVHIQRDLSGQYVVKGDTGMDQSVAASLFDTLAGLRVDRFIEPKHISLPPLRMAIKMVNGTTYRLAFSDPKDPKAAVTDGDQWFTLESEVLANLRTAVAKVSAAMTQQH